MKDAYYFPHDANARHDPKIISLCSRYGISGYACYFQAIEVLREQKNYRLDVKLSSSLSTLWQSYGQDMTAQKASHVLNDLFEFGLLQQKDGYIVCESLNSRMSNYDELRRKRSEAGKIGAAKLWHSQDNAMTKDSYKRKEKKRKEKKIKEEEKEKNDQFVIPEDLKESEQVIRDWIQYKKEKGQTYKAGKGLEALWRRFREIPPAKRREAVEHSMGNNWSGLFQKGGENGNQKADGRSSGKVGEREREDSKFSSVIKTITV